MGVTPVTVPTTQVWWPRAASVWSVAVAVYPVMGAPPSDDGGDQATAVEAGPGRAVTAGRGTAWGTARTGAVAPAGPTAATTAPTTRATTAVTPPPAFLVTAAPRPMVRLPTPLILRAAGSDPGTAVASSAGRPCGGWRRPPGGPPTLPPGTPAEEDGHMGTRRHRVRWSGVAGASLVLCALVVGSSGVGAAPLGSRAVVGTEVGHALPAGSSGVVSNRLDGLACPAPGRCIGVGGTGDAPTGTGTLGATWDGARWGIVPTPSPGPENQLLAVSCTATTACVAAGSTMVDGLLQTLVERWDGAAWAVVPTPDVTGKETVLSGVSCTTASSCVAVGAAWTEDVYDFQTVVERWDGSTWTLVPGTGPAGGGYLADVACTAVTSCTAVGWDDLGHTLVLVGGGTTWVRAVTPDVAGADDALYGVTCLGPSDCTAVGQSGSVTGVGSALVLHGDGSTWTSVPTPPPPGQADDLNHVTCTSTDACVAVGNRFEPAPAGVDPTQDTLVESWDGTAWTVVPSPSPGSWRNNLEDVVCAAPSSCTAVGWSYVPVGDPGTPRTLVESWDGTTWTVVPSPDADALVAPVVGLAATPGGAGYLLADSAGDVVGRGDAVVYGSMSGAALNAPVTHVVATPDGGGYWLVAADGGVFAFGDARFFGSMGGRPLDAPVVGMAPTPDGGGYWLVAADGGVFAFGDARFHGSMGGRPLDRPVVGMAADRRPGATGWWPPTAGSSPSATPVPRVDGRAPAQPARWWAWRPRPTAGATGWWPPTAGCSPSATPASTARQARHRWPRRWWAWRPTPATGGYWLVAADGGVFAFDAPFLGAG